MGIAHSASPTVMCYAAMPALGRATGCDSWRSARTEDQRPKGAPTPLEHLLAGDLPAGSTGAAAGSRSAERIARSVRRTWTGPIPRARLSTIRLPVRTRTLPPRESMIVGTHRSGLPVAAGRRRTSSSPKLRAVSQPCGPSSMRRAVLEQWAMRGLPTAARQAGAAPTLRRGRMGNVDFDHGFWNTFRAASGCSPQGGQ